MRAGVVWAGAVALAMAGERDVVEVGDVPDVDLSQAFNGSCATEVRDVPTVFLYWSRQCSVCTNNVSAAIEMAERFAGRVDFVMARFESVRPVAIGDVLVEAGEREWLAAPVTWVAGEPFDVGLYRPGLERGEYLFMPAVAVLSATGEALRVEEGGDVIRSGDFEAWLEAELNVVGGLESRAADKVARL